MFRFFALCVLLVPAVAAADAPEIVSVVVDGVRDPEWAGYRHAYRAGARFSRMISTRPLIQAHMQIQPLREELSLAGIEVQLQGEKTSMVFRADPIGRVTIPLLKQPYDEDAVLRLNRQKGHYRFGGRFTIREREDGVYDAAMLRAGCEQMLSIQREAGSTFILMGKQCVGVRFIYPLAQAVTLEFRAAAAAPGALASAVERPFDLPPMPGKYQVVTYRFADWPGAGALVAATRPLAIIALYQ
ncbi:MAG TPA: hypothetical protein VGC21_01215 [Telluria sp.]|jgi:hypothetical protein